MCGICGCSEEIGATHPAHHSIIQVEQDLLAQNNRYAADNRAHFLAGKITAINLMSSPGSGKTTLLAKTIAELHDHIPMAVIVGDQETDYDAKKLKSAGATAVQINTGKVCHLDAHSLGHALEHFPLKKRTTLFIENVGNLVCPALFDLGEAYRVVLLSVTEGDNKPLKYPEMFHRADVMLVTKIDLLPYVDFNIDECIAYARRINPSIHVIQLSATTGEGLASWYEWLAENRLTP